MFELKNHKENDVSILEFVGKLNALTASELKSDLNEIVENKTKKVLLHCEELELIDSSGIGAIVSLFKRVRAYGGDVKICGLLGQPKEIFNLLSLDKAFDLSATQSDALSKFAKK